MQRRSMGLGYGWNAERPFLRVRDQGALHSREVLLDGELRFQVLSGRLCVGYYDGERGCPCPGRRAVTRGVMCEACVQRDAFRPCMTCDGTRCPRLSPSMKAYCRQDHHLYLACFGDAQLKVGTASHPRRSRRVVEQGPLAAVLVAQAEGPIIKQMERALSQGVFTETMRRSRKTALLAGSMTTEAAEQLVLEAAARLSHDLPDWMLPLLHEPTMVKQPPFAVESRGYSVQPLQLADDVVIDGKVVGAVGHVAFLEDGDGVFALDLGELKGRLLDWTPESGGRRPVVQLGLF